MYLVLFLCLALALAVDSFSPARNSHVNVRQAKTTQYSSFLAAKKGREPERNGDDGKVSKSMYDSDGNLALGPWLQEKLGDKGAKALALILLSPYLLFAIRGVSRITNRVNSENKEDVCEQK